jgi:molybdopterin-biosynthesis enzyme MoeA-like protein
MLSKNYDFVFTSGGFYHKSCISDPRDRVRLVYEILTQRPTHDDITYDSIASAFNLELKYHEATLDRMKRIGMQMLDQSKGDSQPIPYVLTEPRRRMALFPYSQDSVLSSSVVFPVPSLWVPIVIVNQNVHILPGIIKFAK